MDELIRNRLYESYATTHAGTVPVEQQRGVFDRDIVPHLPTDRQSAIVDIGCGQGNLLTHLTALGFENLLGIDASPEQAALAQANGLACVVTGDFMSVIEGRVFGAVTAIDVLEHLTRPEIFSAFDRIRASLAPAGVLIVRVPNAVSPFHGNYRFGDMTHETSFTARSLHQLGNATGFRSISVYSCPPIVSGMTSAARAAIWKGASGLCKLMLAAETGVLRGHLVTQNVTAVFSR